MKLLFVINLLIGILLNNSFGNESIKSLAPWSIFLITVKDEMLKDFKLVKINSALYILLVFN